MNPNSPGSQSADDIEMIDIDDVPLRSKTNQNGHLAPTINDTYDEDYGGSDDGSRGLLSGSSERARFDLPVGKIWVEVKGIVVEVRVLYIAGGRLLITVLRRVLQHCL
jgi:hypothetical protein